MVVKHVFPLLMDQYIAHQNGMSQVSTFYLPILHSVYVLRNWGCWILSGVWVGFDGLSSKQHATIQEK